MFIDHVTIAVRGGDGGRGCVSWRREKFEPYGGPNGGDGGAGGSVFLQADANTDTLSNFASKKKFVAEKGRFGSGKDKHGRNGEDLVLLVPPGTCITEEGSVIADLARHGDRVLVAHGGRGGYGNAHFQTSVRQAPDFAELGEPGSAHVLSLELKLVADVGIIGYPNVGKSTLISVVSASKPKIADYPFTTLVPNLGVVTVGDRSFVVCDIPGLIEGASEGRGLGDQFLRHIERCRILLHVLDVSRALEGTTCNIDLLVKDYRTIRKELSAYSPALSTKKELIIVNKIDLIPEQQEDILLQLRYAGVPVFAVISAATKSGTNQLMKALLPLILAQRLPQTTSSEGDSAPLELPVLRPHEVSIRMGAYRIDKAADGSLHIAGKRLEQFTVMTDFAAKGGRDRFLDVVERIGLMKEIRRLRKDEETPIFIGLQRIEEYL